MTAALAIAVLLGVVAALFLAGELKDARYLLEQEKGRTDALRKELAETYDAATRVEQTVAYLKASVAQSEYDLAQCRDPDVVRRRLRELLLSPDVTTTRRIAPPRAPTLKGPGSPGRTG